jgi:hypothetical protein
MGLAQTDLTYLAHIQAQVKYVYKQFALPNWVLPGGNETRVYWYLLYYIYQSPCFESYPRDTQDLRRRTEMIHDTIPVKDSHTRINFSPTFVTPLRN